MSRTRHREKKAKCGIGKEYWSGRWHPYGESTGRWTKTMTHRFERRKHRKEIEFDLKANGCMV